MTARPARAARAPRSRSSFGICTSRNRRSGESSVTALTASNRFRTPRRPRRPDARPDTPYDSPGQGLVVNDDYTERVGHSESSLSGSGSGSVVRNRVVSFRRRLGVAAFGGSVVGGRRSDDGSTSAESRTPSAERRAPTDHPCHPGSVSSRATRHPPPLPQSAPRCRGVSSGAHVTLAGPTPAPARRGRSGSHGFSTTTCSRPPIPARGHGDRAA